MLLSLKKNYYLGVDGGGTKTEAIIADESGFILSGGMAGGSNPHNMKIEDCFSNIEKAVKLAKEGLIDKKPEIIPELIKFDGVCLGIAGLDTKNDRELMSDAIRRFIVNKKNSFIKARRIMLINDGFIALKAGTETNWGISLIAATGANCYGVNRSGKEAIAGDWGYVLGDQGSAYALGTKILRQVIKEHDGRRPKTTLTERVLKELNLDSVEDLVSWTYRSGFVPVRNIAALAKIIGSDDINNLVEISEFINESVRELVEAYESVVKKLKIEEEKSIPVILSGGLFHMKSKFSEKVKIAIKNRTPNAQIIFPKKTPAEGAALVARLLTQRFDLFPNTAISFVNPDFKK